MTSLAARVTVFRRSEVGATAVEYALMVTFIAMVIIAAVVILGTNLSTIFANASTRI
ncbi:Flp family type IVb pilin [Oryzobacter telluris]|uniref:Flp family type IVb pilin n=1 Tax=Oryzobacter telluris TaxID=3149179 RepID=UPI00370DB034